MKTALTVPVAASLLFFATAASAADIFTPPLRIGSATSSVDCRVLNTGTTTANGVVIEIRDKDNGLQASGGPFSLPAGTTQNVNDSTPASVAYCRVHGIFASKARVTLCLLDAFTNPLQCTTAP